MVFSRGSCPKKGSGLAKSRLTLVSDWVWAGGSPGSGKGDFLLRNLLSNLMFLELFLVQERGEGPLWEGGGQGRGIERGLCKVPRGSLGLIDIVDFCIRLQ